MNSLNVIIALFQIDRISFTRWWRKRFLSNTFVSLAFFFVFLLISIFIYGSSYTFLLPLSRYEVFGRQTAIYLVNASIIITIWLGIASSFISNLSFLLSRNRSLDYLNTLPLRSFPIVLFSFIKSILSSLIWTLFIFLPLGLVTQRLFIERTDLFSLLNLVLVIGLVVMISTIVGVVLSVIYSKIFHSSHSSYYIFGMTLLFIFLTVFLIRLILPPTLGSLISLPIERFNEIFMSLPLNKYFLPTLYLTRLLFQNSLEISTTSFIGIAIFCFISLYVVARQFIPVRQLLASTSYRSKKYISKFSSLSIVKKDIYSIIRNQTEMGYGLFLLGLIVGFFYFFYTSVHRSFIYSLGWFLFYSLAYLLRLVYPLMAKEGVTAWYIFTKPITTTKFLTDKLIASFLIALPIFLLGILLSLAAGLSSTPVWGSFVLFLVVSLMGNISPNFKEGGNSERVSTSLMGIATLILGLFFIFTLTQPKAVNLAILFSFIAPSILFISSLVSIHRYRF